MSLILLLRSAEAPEPVVTEQTGGDFRWLWRQRYEDLRRKREDEETLILFAAMMEDED